MGIVDHSIRDDRDSPEAATDEPASSFSLTAPGGPLEFDPVPLRHRRDGWTPERQREYVEALADTGVARQAAAIVGMTEQSACRLRRRPEGRVFDLICNAALRHGARRLVSIAYQRAIEGTVKRHYYHGELKSEEIVYDNRLLIALIQRLPRMEADAAADAVLADWAGWTDALEQGLDAPPPPPEPENAPEPAEPFEAQVWEEDDGTWLTDAPPPEDFDGFEDGTFGGTGLYQRTLTEEEQEAWDDELQEEAWQDTVSYGGFYHLGRPTFFPLAAEPYEPSGSFAGGDGP